MAEDVPPEVDPLEQALRWIGFTNPEATAVADEFRERDLSAFSKMKEKTIKDMATDFASRTGNDKIIFKMYRKQSLLDMIPWSKDWRRLGEEPSLDGLDREAFLAELDQAHEREVARLKATESRDTRAKTADPGKLLGQKNWETWFSKMILYLAVCVGVMDVPLLYVVRDSIPADEDAEEADDFTKKCIQQLPHAGDYYKLDARRVHEDIWHFCAGEESEQHLKATRKFEDGARDFEALVNHYEGAGNTARRIADAERMRVSLHYRSESAMTFESFLAKCKKMFAIYEKIGEPWKEEAKVRFLLDKCNGCASFTPMIASIQNSIVIMKAEVTFDSAASALVALIKPKERSDTRQVSAVGGDTGAAPTSGIMKGNQIWTGLYPNWNQLSQADKNKVAAERKRLGIEPPVKGSGKKGGGGGKAAKKKDHQKNEIKNLKRRINALEAEKHGDDEDIADVEKDDKGPGNAGNAFGGRESMAKKKGRKD